MRNFQKRLLALILFLLFSSSSVLAITNLEKSVKLYDIYESKFSKALEAKQIEDLEILAPQLKRYLTKIEEITSLTETEQNTVNDRKSRYSNVINAFVQLKNQKPRKTPPQIKSEGNYHSSVGTTIGTDVSWMPKPGLSNTTGFSVSDSTIRNISYKSHSAFENYEVNLDGFSDSRNSNNSNIQLELKRQQNQALLGVDNVDLDLGLQTRFQDNQNNIQVTGEANKTFGKKAVTLGQIANVNETSGGDYLQSYLRLTDHETRNFWGFQHHSNSFGELSLFPGDGRQHVIYTGINQQMQKENWKTNHQWVLNYLPNNSSASYIFFSNRFQNNQTFWKLNTHALNFDFKLTNVDATEYLRLAATSGFTTLYKGIPVSNRVGLDIFNFSASASSYYMLFVQSQLYTASPSAIFKNPSAKLGRRTYPRGSNSAWDLSFSDFSPWQLWPNLLVDRRVNINFVFYDAPTAVRSNSLVFGTALSQTREIFNLPMNLELGLSYQHFPQNQTADGLVLQFTSEVDW